MRRGWMRSQIGQRRTFIKLISFIHFGRWNVYSINPPNPMILTWQSNQPWPRPNNNSQTPTSHHNWSRLIWRCQINIIGFRGLMECIFHLPKLMNDINLVKVLLWPICDLIHPFPSSSNSPSSFIHFIWPMTYQKS